MRLLDDIIGKEILDSDAKIIGKVKDIEIDSSSKIIESIIVSKNVQKSGFGKRLGNREEEDNIPIEMVSRIGDKILLKKDIMDYEFINI